MKKQIQSTTFEQAPAPDPRDIITRATHAAIERAHVLAERRANLERLWREGNVILRQLVQHPADIRYFMPPTLDSLETAVANAQA